MKNVTLKCSKSLLNAKNIWNSNQDLYSAYLVAKELAKIDPNSACFSDIQVFTNSIAKRVFELDKREWDFKLKQQQDGVELSKSIIDAARDIGVAYGNNQPDVVYNTTLIRTWW